jgi:hypothetical protein
VALGTAVILRVVTGIVGFGYLGRYCRGYGDDDIYQLKLKKLKYFFINN